MRVQFAQVLFVLTPLLFADNVTAQTQCPEVTKKFEDVLGLQGSPVIFVEKVIEHSAAETAGISRFDLILSFNGEDLRQFPNPASFLTELRIAAIKDRAEIEILKYDRRTGSYSPSRVTVTLAGSRESYVGLRSSFGYFVLGVSDGRVADRMGVRPGSFIDEVNGEKVANMDGPIGLDKIFQDIALRPSHQFTLLLAKRLPTEDGGRKAETRKLTGSF